MGILTSGLWLQFRIQGCGNGNAGALIIRIGFGKVEMVNVKAPILMNELTSRAGWSYGDFHWQSSGCPACSQAAQKVR